MSVGDTLRTLLENYSNAIEDGLFACYVFDRDGLILAQFQKNTFKQDPKQEAEILGAISSVVEPTLKRITSEMAGFFGSGVFETEDHRLVFTEAGDHAILLTVVGFDAHMSNILPYTYLVAEKITAFLENPDNTVQVSVPNLRLGFEFDIENLKNSNQIGKIPTDLRLKLVIVGDPAVGKTSIISKFVTQKIPADYRPTLGISITAQTYKIQNKVLNFLIWDLAGQKFFQRVRKKYYHGSHAAFVMYDATRRETFDIQVEKWFNDLRSILPDIPIVLIGNKIDLAKKRQVTTTEGEKLAKKLGCSFLETSAKSGENVKDAFSLIGIGLFFKLQPHA
ncbi:MAG: GTP-binding protein [Promethearchaeota archaeon]